MQAVAENNKENANGLNPTFAKKSGDASAKETPQAKRWTLADFELGRP